MARGGDEERASASRRSFVRFPALCRVEYEHSEKGVIGFTSEISSGGLFIQGATFLETGDTVDLDLFLVPGDPPLNLCCLVRHVSRSGAGVEIMRGQVDKTDAIRSYIDGRLATRLRDRVDVRKAEVRDIVQLAAYYCEARRYDDALDVYREALEARPDEGKLYEGLALLLVQRIREVSLDATPMVEELEDVLDRGLERGSSSGLVAAQRELGALREGEPGEFDTTTRLDLASADALLRGAQTQDLDARESRLEELGRALDERQAELEAEQQQLVAESARLEDERNSLSRERTDIGQEKLSLDKVRAELDEANAELRAKQERVDGEVEALEREQERASPFGPPTVADAEVPSRDDEDDWGGRTLQDNSVPGPPPLHNLPAIKPREPEAEPGDWGGLTGRLVHAARHDVAPRVTQAFKSAGSYARANLVAAAAIGAAATALVALTIIAFSPDPAVVMSTVTVEGPPRDVVADSAAGEELSAEGTRGPRRRPAKPRNKRKRRKEARAKAAPEAAESASVEKAPRAKLGVKVRQVDIATAEAAGMMGVTGAFVTSVTVGGAGAAAGVKPGDIILSVDGRTIKNARGLAPAVAKSDPGTPVKLVVWRDKRAVILSVPL